MLDISSFLFSFSPSIPSFSFQVPVVFSSSERGSMSVHWEIQMGVVFALAKDFGCRSAVCLLIKIKSHVKIT